MAKKQLKTAPEAASASPAAGAKPTTKSSAKTPVTSSTKSNSASREPRVTASKHSRANAVKSSVDSQASEALALDAVTTQAAASPHVTPSEALQSVDAIPQQHETLIMAMTNVAHEHTPEAQTPEEHAPVTTPAQATTDPRDAIAKLAYSYYEARGYAHGNPDEDWARAEREYYGRS